MIDLQIESALTLATAAKLPQLKRDGRSPHISQLYRWIESGLKGHRLDSIVVAGTRCTTSEAVDRWIAALSGHDSPDEQSRTPLRRQRDQEQADQQLAAAGW